MPTYLTWLGPTAFVLAVASCVATLYGRKQFKQLSGMLDERNQQYRNLEHYAAELKRKLELSDDALGRERTRRDAALKDLDAMMLDPSWRGHGAPTRAVHGWVERLEQSLEKGPGWQAPTEPGEWFPQ